MSTFTARDGLVFKAKLSEESERYNDMAEALAGVIKMGEGLNSQERNMMSIAFKNRIGTGWFRKNFTEPKTAEKRLKMIKKRLLKPKTT